VPTSGTTSVSAHFTDLRKLRTVAAAALYPDRCELKTEYPELTDEDIAQALNFAARNLDDQIFPLEAASPVHTL
jgi:hypothetical protein